MLIHEHGGGADLSNFRIYRRLFAGRYSPGDQPAGVTILLLLPRGKIGAGLPAHRCQSGGLGKHPAAQS